ncbi:MAG: NAD(P)-dependent oxidoreductase, partial [Anaerolineales bacterium]|nr:NAD(P)-dependent oxidoreductase [Anaerolineales bacterium]
MRVLITGSSGQIGTNLGLYLQEKGHQVFGVDKRVNTWTDQISTIIQDLSQPYHNFAGGIGIEYPDNLDVVVHFAAHAKVHELVEQPYRALENITMTFNVLEFCRQ